MIEFRLLGSVDLKGSEGETLRSVLAQPKRVALLAYLAVAQPNGYHRRDKLLGLFWPESDQERGRGALRKALYFLRQSLGEEVIVSRGDEEIGLAEGALWCDAVAFEAALEVGKPEEALELYRGDLLEGFFLSEVPEFERWLEVERERLRRRASEAAWILADGAEAAANGVEAAKWARRAVSFTPNDEAAIRRQLELLDRLGNRSGAIQEYESFAKWLREEYEAEPSPETQALIAAIREREVAAVAGSPERPAESPAGVARAVTPEPIAVTPRPEPHAGLRPVSLLRVLATYGVVSLAVLVAVHILTLQLGLPGWFFPSAVVVLLVCLPIIVATALVQGAVASARAAGAESAPSSVASRWLTWRNSIVGGSLAFVLLGVAVTGYTGMRATGIGPWGTLIGRGVLEKRDRIVLAEFEDHTNDSTLALTVTEAIRVDLGQSPAFRVAERDFVRQALERMEKDPDAPLTYDLAREVAIREGLKAVVTGEINRAGSGFVLSARLVAAETGEDLYSARETAEGLDPIVPAIDRLSARLRDRIGESLKTIRASLPLSQVRTASLQALRLYTEAERANLRGDFRRAVDLHSLALEIDTMFASAYGGRAIALSNLMIAPAQRNADRTRAYELRDRLPLWERYLAEAVYHFGTGNYENVIEDYRMILELRPEYAPAVNNLGLAYYRLGDYARAEEMFDRRLEMDSLAGISWYNLARAQFNQGKYSEAHETLRQYETQIPEDASIPELRANFSSAQGDYDAARANLRRRRYLRTESLLEQARFNRHMGRLAQVEGKLAEARSYFRDAMAAYEEGDMPVGYLLAGIQNASILLWFLGDTTGALDSVTAALRRKPLDSIEPLNRPYLALAGFHAFAGAPERARELLVEWERVIPLELRRRPADNSRRLEWGAVALVEGRVDEALSEFRFADKRSTCSICSLPLLGRTYELGGQMDSALALYERYLATPYYLRTLDGSSPEDGRDPFWLPVVYERLGDLYEQRADTAKAIYYYSKLVDLWKGADPELQPRVEAARRAIEALSPDT